MSAPYPQTIALQLARRILADALAATQINTTMVRDLSGRIGELEQAIRSAITVMDQLAPSDEQEAGG